MDDSRHSPSISSERSVSIPPRTKKPTLQTISSLQTIPTGRAPLPPPRRLTSQQSYIVRSQSTDAVPMEYIYNNTYPIVTTHFQSATAITTAIPTTIAPISTNVVTSTVSGNNTSTNTAVGLSSQNSVSTTTTTVSTGVTSTAHGDPQLEDTNSTDSSSFDDELKKRRRKLRFPFGKKSIKSKLA